MPVRKLHLFPDPVLARPSKAVTEFGPSLAKLILDLEDTLRTTPGVGLAAPQIGVLEQVSIVDVSKAKRGKKQVSSISHGKIILINPSILEESETRIVREGCLSVPDFLANVTRFYRVSVRTQDLNGEARIILSEGFEALALQHEIDHLQGKLFLDRVSNVHTDIFRRSTY